MVHSGRRAPTLTTATSSTPACCLSVCLSVFLCVCYVHDIFMLCYIFILQLCGVPNVVHSGRRAPTLTTATSSTPACCMSVCVCVCYVHDMFMLCYIFVLQLRGVPNVVHSGRRAPTLTTATSSTPACCLSVCLSVFLCVCYVHDIFMLCYIFILQLCGVPNVVHSGRRAPTLTTATSSTPNYCLSVCVCVCVCVMFMIYSCYVIFSFYSYVECQMWCILGGEPPL